LILSAFTSPNWQLAGMQIAMCEASRRHSGQAASSPKNPTTTRPPPTPEALQDLRAPRLAGRPPTRAVQGRQRRDLVRHVGGFPEAAQQLLRNFRLAQRCKVALQRLDVWQGYVLLSRLQGTRRLDVCGKD
jgi:hypothetical protein